MAMIEMMAGPDQRKLEHLLHRGLERARSGARPVVVSTTTRMPTWDALRWFERCTHSGGERHFFARPGGQLALAGLGTAWTITVQGEDRFSQAATAWRDLLTDAVIDAPAGVAGTGPILMGGFAFDPARPSTPLWEGYPDGLLTLPRYLLTTEAGTSWLTVTSILWPDSNPQAELHTLLDGCRTLPAGDTPERRAGAQAGAGRDVMPRAEWQAIVEGLTGELQQGQVEKVVLARACQVFAADRFDVPAVLRRLRSAYPSCYHFAMTRGESCFLGATPEQLVRLRNGQVQAMCLAGSVARGATDEGDQRLGRELLTSAKDRAEHLVVVRVLGESLAGLCSDVTHDATPSLMKVHNVQHLLTSVIGQITGGQTILDLVGRLHPTPAVGGYPREEALRLIREREGMDRGWYAGPLGWLDARGEGEFAVALRSALLHGGEATLFAGCGIMADSHPDSEYAESCLKLRPLLMALGATG